MEPNCRRTALLVAVAYLLPLVVLPTLHVVQEGSPVDCACRGEERPGGPAFRGQCTPDGGPCSHSGHHHHPDRCQVCRSLAQTPVAIVQVTVTAAAPAFFPHTIRTTDSGYQAEVLTPLCRGPPVA